MSIKKALIGILALSAGGIWLAYGLRAQPQPSLGHDGLRAMGDLTDIPAPLRPLFNPKDFKRLGPPDSSDWLANHHEPGQTFEQFVAGAFNKPDGQRTKIYLQPIGAFSGDSSPALDQLQECAAAYFGMPVSVLPVLRPKPDQITSRTNPGTGKKQLLTTDLLDLLRSRLPQDAYCVLGVTMTDLYPDPDWNFVFGSASIRARVGVFSFARYDPAFFGHKRPVDFRTTLIRRSCKVLTHETGHMFGMYHCTYYDCGMNGSNHMAESDSRPIHLCPVCLRKLFHAVGFGLVDRYQKLYRYYQRVGLKPEANWIKMRLARLGLPAPGSAK